MLSPMFWHPRLYELTVRLMYGANFHRRYLLVAQLTAGLPVLDVCCGDGYLANYLKHSAYQGVEFYSRFVRHCQQKGLAVQRLDIRRDTLPVSPCVVMMASLYQFLPDYEPVLEKLIQASSQRLIIAEPVHNLAHAANPLLAWLARHLADPSGGTARSRFNEASLRDMFTRYGFQRVFENGREWVGVLDKK